MGIFEEGGGRSHPSSSVQKPCPLPLLHAAVSVMKAGCGSLGITLPVPSVASPTSAVLRASPNDSHQDLRALWGICMSCYGPLLGVDCESSALTAMKHKESQVAVRIVVGEWQHSSISHTWVSFLPCGEQPPSLPSPCFSTRDLVAFQCCRVA